MAMLLNRESVALEILQNPECFASLPKRSDHERQICLWQAPSFSPHSSWSIFESFKTKEFVVRRLEHDPSIGLPVNVKDPHIFGSEALIDNNSALNIIRSFESLSVPMFRRPTHFGLDGNSYGVIVGSYWQRTSVNWWGESPVDWEELVDLFQSTVQPLDQALPESTLRTGGP